MTKQPLSYEGYVWERWLDGLYYGPRVQDTTPALQYAQARGAVSVMSQQRGDYRYVLRSGAFEELAAMTAVEKVA